MIWTTSTNSHSSTITLSKKYLRELKKLSKRQVTTLIWKQRKRYKNNKKGRLVINYKKYETKKYHSKLDKTTDIKNEHFTIFNNKYSIAKLNKIR